MHYISTRNADHPVTLGEAIARGIAPDGGLYVPQEFPHFSTRQFETDLELPQIHALSLYTPSASVQQIRCAARVRSMASFR